MVIIDAVIAIVRQEDNQREDRTSYLCIKQNESSSLDPLELNFLSKQAMNEIKFLCLLVLRLLDVNQIGKVWHVIVKEKLRR